MKKTLGYSISAIGILIVALSYSQVRSLVGLSLSTGYDLYLIALGVIVIAIGAFMLYGKSRSKHTEVPIYEGKDIVGYRRHGN